MVNRMVSWLPTSAMASFLNMGEKVRRNSVSKTEFCLFQSRTDMRCGTCGTDGPGDQGRAQETWAWGTRQEGRTRCSFRIASLHQAEPSRAEPSRAEPSRVMPSQIMVDCCLCWLTRTRGHDGLIKINKMLIKINKILRRPPLDLHGTGGRGLLSWPCRRPG
jgi:hypothetical protein